MQQQTTPIVKITEGELEDSFKLFSKLATDLTDAYTELQEHVTDLTSRLETVTQERLVQLQEKERIANQLQKLLSMLPAAVVVLDGNGVVQECNPTAIELLKHKLVGFAWRDVIKLCFSPKEDDGHEISLVDGRRVNITIRPLEEEPGQIIVMHDMTETRELQEALSRDKRLKAIGTMVASLAHQIRTPITTALLYASHLTESDLSEEQRKKFSHKIISRLKSIENQVKDMLFCAKGEQLLFEKNSLQTIIDEIQKSSDETISQFNASCHINCVETNLEIDCNLEAVVGAIQNLINNAIEACPNRVEIQIQIAVLKQHIKVVVRDNGPGIEPELLKKVTEPFFTTRANGTGLGLDVVRAVTQAHNGSFKIESEVDSGTSVSILLPINQKNETTQNESQPVIKGDIS